MSNKENNNIGLYSLKGLYEMKKSGSIGIPAVQRGLVWEPSKIVNLWDSLVKGYPIGIFQCYNDSSGAKALIDGQQRLNAICLGFENSEQATMWVAEKDDGEPVFMVCTKRHPWGYQREEVSNGVRLNAFSAAKRDEQNQELKNDADKQDIFKIADLKEGMPMEQYHKYKYCPLPSILNSDTPPAGFEKLWNSDWATRMRDIGNEIVPLVTIPDFKPEPAKLREVFARINRGGSPLSARDELYSAVCVYGETETFSIKEENNVLRENFLPAERITRLAARMAKSAVSAQKGKRNYTANVSTETICDWFKQGDAGAAELLRLYGEDKPLQRAKDTFMAYIGKEDDLNRVPSYVYLSDREDNWLYVIFSLIEHYPCLFNENADLAKKYFPLLCLLPYVMCGTNAAQGRRNFCEGFYNAAMNTDSVGDLLELMAIGLVGASFYPAFTWPYPADINNAADEKDNMRYSTYWLDIFRSIYGRADNNILYYFQRRYVNRMLQSGFDPAEPSTWQSHENRPWDMDHVIPDSWWSGDDNNIRNEIGNMQIMYFRHNRMKNDSYAGAYDLSQSHAKEDEEISSHFLYNQETYDSITQESTLSVMRKLVRARQGEIIKKVYEDLHVRDLTKRVLDCKYTGQSWMAKAAKIRYDVFKKLNNHFDGFNQWGICTYFWRRQQKKVEYGTWIALDDKPTFYDTLTTWLLIGEKIKFRGVDVLWAVQSEINPGDRTISYQAIFSRPTGVSRDEWITVCNAAGWQHVNDWVATEDSNCQGELSLTCRLLVDDIPNVVTQHFEEVRKRLLTIWDSARLSGYLEDNGANS